MIDEHDSVQKIRAAAEREFAKHQITELSRNGVFRTWKCATPGTWAHGFLITTIPGSLIVTGDLGELIVSRTYDMLPWARRAVRDLHYFASKTSQNFKTREFSHDAFEDWKADTLSELRKNAYDNPGTEAETHYDRFRESYEDFEAENYGHDELLREFQGWYDDPPDWCCYSSAFLWIVEAVRWFVENHSEPEVQQPQSNASAG